MGVIREERGREAHLAAHRLLIQVRHQTCTSAYVSIRHASIRRQANVCWQRTAFSYRCAIFFPFNPVLTVMALAARSCAAYVSIYMYVRHETCARGDGASCALVRRLAEEHLHTSSCVSIRQHTELVVRRVRLAHPLQTQRHTERDYQHNALPRRAPPFPPCHAGGAEQEAFAHLLSTRKYQYI